MPIRYIGSSIALLALVALTVACYWPGLHGGFLFDDFHNLDALGDYGDVGDWETLKSFVLGGRSGPTGRPLSLLSFLLDDNTWPSDAARFKSTNLAIHLLCGLLLAWATLLTLRLYGIPETRAQWCAVFSAGCWLLHPFLVSTTLYVVQRMAQLAALFAFAGIVGYLHGRRLLPTRPRSAYLWMGSLLLFGTVLAVLSKENGILLPLLVGVIEFCAPPSTRSARPTAIFRAMFIWLPSLAVFAYLASNINFSPDLWPTRGFNQIERLLSEPRIVWDYLGNLWVPRIEGQGLYRDDFVLSRNLLTPDSTLPAIVALLSLATAAFALRRRWPLFSLAILFFLAGHLLESTVIGLELYFEHRNYLPSAFLFLPLASGLHRLGQTVSKKIPSGIAVIIIALLAFFTWSRAQLWADSDRLELYWATSATNSPRAQNALAAYYMRRGLTDEANKQIAAAAARIPDSALLSIRLLLQKVWTQQATESDFADTANRLARQPFDAQAIVGLRTIVDKVTEPNQPSLYRSSSIRLIDALGENAHYNTLPLFLRLVPYLKGEIYLSEGQPELALAQLTDAMVRYGDTDAALQMVALTASHGYIVQAERLLDQAEALYRQQPDRTLKRSRHVYDQEFPRLRKAMRNERKKNAMQENSVSIER